MAFNLAGLSAYTDQVSFGVISQVILESTIMNHVTKYPGNPAGTVAINLLTSVLAPALASCGWNAAGTASFTQVNMNLVDYQVKETYCPEDLRPYWLSSQLSASGNLTDIPYTDMIIKLKTEQIQKEVERVIFQGGNGINGLLAEITGASGAASQNVATGGLTAAAWTSSNSLAQAQALVTALPSNVLSQPDLTMYMSYASFRALSVGMVNANLFHYVPGNGTGNPSASQSIIIPGTNVTAVPFDGMGTSNVVFAGPASMIVVGLGLADDTEGMGAFYDPYNDQYKFVAKYRIGVKPAFTNYFAVGGTTS